MVLEVRLSGQLRAHLATPQALRRRSRLL